MTFDCVGSKKNYRTPAERALIYCLRGFDTKMGGQAKRSARGCKHQIAMGVGGGAGEPGGRGRVKGGVRGERGGAAALSRGSSASWRPTGPLRPLAGRRVALRPPRDRRALFGLPAADGSLFGPPEADGVTFLIFLRSGIRFPNLYQIRC